MLKHCVIWLICLLSFSCVSHEDWRSEGVDVNSLRIRIAPLPTSRATNGLAENTVRDVKYLLFNANGDLEATYTFNHFPENEVLFEHLTTGLKTLVVLANTADTSSIDPIEIPSQIKKHEFDALMVKMRAPYIFEEPKSIPMVYERELEIPAQNPVVDVALDRLFVRLRLNNDLSNGAFEIDSLTFRHLSGSMYIANGNIQKAPEANYTIRPSADSSIITTYILPCSAKQVEYSVFGKIKNGPQQIIKGKINPELKENYSYTMSLSTGEIIEDGTPRSLKVIIDQAVGSYSTADSTIVLGINGGSFSISAESLDSLEIVSGATWLAQAGAATRSERFPSTFNLRSDQHISSDDERETMLSIRNKYDSTRNWSLHVRQTGENRGPKYYVLVVAGQSNASGRDKTPYDANYDAVSPRIFEFGQAGITPPYNGKYGTSSTMDILPLTYIAHNLDSNKKGAKSSQLPIAKEMLKHIPDDYDILVVSVAYSGSGFAISTSSPLGVYDPVTMRPVNFPASLPSFYRIKAREGVMYNMIVDRVKYALKLNKRNKLAGVVWMQGESETSSNEADPHKGFHMFEDFAQAFTDDINGSIPSEQIALGKFSRNMWFNLEQTPARRYWQDVNTGSPMQFARSHYYGGYKIWNYSTFIKLPDDTGMNPGDEVHFGQNAFRITVAPLTIQNMVDNGIFGGTPNTRTKFTRQITEAEIIAQYGSISDQDIQDRLIAWFPFSDATNIGRNLSVQSESVSVVNHGIQVAATEGMIGPDKNPRASKALALTPNSGHYMEINNTLTRDPAGWSVSMMLRRFNGLDNLKDQNLLLIPETKRGLAYHRYMNESEGGYLTLSFQPSSTTYQRLHSVTERLSDASYLRSNEEWVHLTYTFDNATRVCKVYMNGELTMNYTMPVGTTVSNLKRLVLNDAANGVDAQIRDLCIWDRAISAETVFKVYLIGYYGGDAKIDIDLGIGDWEDNELN